MSKEQMIMIDVSNLKDALETLGFVAHGDIHEKVFPEIGCSLKVDFHAKKLIYPNEIKGRERNNGFDKKENFVVFECVCRLLSMWGDRIFEKCGIRRDEGGDGGKTLEIRGKRRLSARDGGANYQQS